MVGMGAFLIALGAFAAWNVHKQQQTSSELVIREVRGMVAIDELHMAMREIRYQVNIFLRTYDPRHLLRVTELHAQADKLLLRAKGYARTDSEQELIGVVEEGYREFFEEFQTVTADLLDSELVEVSQPLGTLPVTTISVTAEQSAALTRLSDDVLTNRVLEPLRQCLQVNQQVVEKTNEA